MATERLEEAQGWTEGGKGYVEHRDHDPAGLQAKRCGGGERRVSWHDFNVFFVPVSFLIRLTHI